MTVVPYSDPAHQPVVPPWAGFPWCTCGWRQKRREDPMILADHLREVDSVPLSSNAPPHSRTEEEPHHG